MAVVLWYGLMVFDREGGTSLIGFDGGRKLFDRGR